MTYSSGLVLLRPMQVAKNAQNDLERVNGLLTNAAEAQL